MIPEAQDLTCRLVSCLFLCVVHMLVETIWDQGAVGWVEVGREGCVSRFFKKWVTKRSECMYFLFYIFRV